MGETDLRSPPALYGHCNTVFEFLRQRAQPAEMEDQKIMVFTGKLTKVFTELGLSTPYYTSVMQALQGMDCVRQLKRGGGGSDSQWALVQPPTWKLFEFFSKSPEIQTPAKKQDASRDQQTRDLKSRVDKLESQVNMLIEMVKNIASD